MTHSDSGFDMTPNTIPQTSVKVDMTSRFLELVVSLSRDEQNLWFSKPGYVDRTASSSTQKGV